jgi:nicotinate-nucleotide pyrophosphorylase (carboxylating)
MKSGQFDGYHSPSILWKQHLHRGLEEDGWVFDWTSLSLGQVAAHRKVRARIIAKAEGIWAGQGLIPAAEALSHEMGGPVVIRSHLKQGAPVRPGTLVCEWEGAARVVLALERTFLNLACYVSGIATQTFELTSRVSAAYQKASWKYEGQCPRVTSTRKTLPGYRDIALEGVIAGGGMSHRYNLAGGVLLKENHIAAAGGVGKAVQQARKHVPHVLRVECEVRNRAELTEAVDAGAEAVLLDNFSPAQVAEVLPELRTKGTIVEVSGGITTANITEYVQNGVHILSSGSLTHSVKALDLSLLVDE